MEFHYGHDSRLKAEPNAPVKTPPERVRKPISLKSIILLVGLFSTLVFSSIIFVAKESISSYLPEAAKTLREIAGKTAAFSPPPVVKDAVFRKNDTFYKVLIDSGLSALDAERAAITVSKYFDLRSVKEGDKLKVVFRNDKFESARYMYSSLRGFSVTVENQLTPSVMRFDEVSLPTRVSVETGRGVIQSSLYESGVDAGMDPVVIMALSDIFAWQVDFSSDIRRGDSFAVVYENIYAADAPGGDFGNNVGPGRILSAEVVNDGHVYKAFYFTDKDGRGDYFDENGESLSRNLLKSPLRYRRISSSFSKGRFHPVLKRYRPHHGIDYAAPTGTPVETSGDGIVTYAGWKGGYGNFVTVKHNASYTTSYGHFSKIAKGIKKGVRVEQGKVIGYVGSTGISTGPHLHYEIKINGKLVNPLGVKSEPRRALSGSDLAAFNSVKSDMTARLSANEKIASAR